MSMRPASMAGSRRSKIEALREREALKEHRGRLQSMLAQKLVHKYGATTKGAAINRKIANVVSEFMSTHSRISEGDLVMLEESVAKAIGKAGPDAGPPLSASTSMPAIPAAMKSAPAPARPMTSSMAPAPAATGGGLNIPSAFPTTNEWTLLDTYNAIENEELSKKSHVVIRQRQAEFKAELDAQKERNAGKSGQEKQADQKYLAEQTRMLAEWKSTQEAKTKGILDRNHEEKRVREQQIEARKQAREAERAERQMREEKELTLCRREISRQEQLVRDKKQAERDRLQKIRIENAKENEVRAKRAAEEAAEDQRLMHEYKAKLDKEESDRASAFARRMARLEQFSAKSGNEEGGAVYEQQKAEREFEEIVLKEALKKEQADLERERSDKEKLRMSKIKMAHENKKLMMKKKEAFQTHQQEESQYANRFRREGEEYLREEHDRFVSNRKKAIEHQDMLSSQIEATRAANAKVDMSERERQMNRQMLLKVAGDQDLMEKIKAKLTVGQTRAASAPLIGFGAGGDDEA